MELSFIHINIKVQLSNMNDLFCNLFNLTILISHIEVSILEMEDLDSYIKKTSETHHYNQGLGHHYIQLPKCI